MGGGDKAKTRKKFSRTKNSDTENISHKAKKSQDKSQKSGRRGMHKANDTDSNLRKSKSTRRQKETSKTLEGEKIREEPFKYSTGLDDVVESVYIESMDSTQSKKVTFEEGEEETKPDPKVTQKQFIDSVQNYREKLNKAKREGRTGDIIKLMRGRTLESMLNDDEDVVKDEVPIPEETLKKYQRAEPVTSKIKVDDSKKILRQAKRAAQERSAMEMAVKLSAKSEFILPEAAGFIQADEGEATSDVTQHDIVKSADLQTAQKHFTLLLKNNGAYCIDYSQNGRYLALASSLGHTAVVDWQPKTLKCEFNVRETTHDIKYLHNETMLAVAQRQWAYIYDNEGVELHCLKILDSPLQLQFLRFHFLLACSNAKGYLSWIDVSTGDKVAGFQTHRGRLNIMAQNPCNAILHLGHSRGTVTLWSPNSKDSLVEMLCHNSAVRSICMDKTGMYMATSGLDRQVKVWDLRTYKCLHGFKVPAGASSLSYSSRGLLAASYGSVVQVYQDTLIKPPEQIYMTHRAQADIRQVLFCPYEDVLGVGSSQGYESLLIPGAGEPNFDSLEANPYQTKKQRQHQEVKQLLDKIPFELISLEPESISQVREENAELDAKNSAPKKWLKYHYTPSKAIMESKRRWELKKKLAVEKEERHKRYVEEKTNPQPYNPLKRFKFGG